MRSSRFSPLSRAALLTMVLAAMFARLMVPQGWMPAMDGSVTLVPCSGTGPVTMPAAAMPMHGQHHMPAKHDGKVESPCAFTAVGQALLDSEQPAVVQLAVAPVATSPAAMHDVAIGRGLAAPPPPATGPPATA